MTVTLTQLPHIKQVAAHALLEQGCTIRAIAKQVGISPEAVIAIKRRVPSNIADVERIKKALPALQYSDAMEYRRNITSEKLEKMSAYQLQGMVSLAVTTARDMEGLNRPTYNIIDIASNIDKLMEDSKMRLQAIEARIVSTQTHPSK